MGYPIVTGTLGDVIVYQGNLVRSYVIPTDPRSGAQLQVRRLFSDMQRMKSQLGEFGKGALRNALGPKWSTNIFQLAKADINGWYSDAVAEWDEFLEGNKEDWREVAPYRVTFNDLGLVFFALSRVIYHALDHYGGYTWEAEEWGETESGDALAWWQKDLTGVYMGGWHNEYPTQAAYFWGSWIGMETSRGPSGGSVQATIDGVAGQSWSLYYMTPDTGGWWTWSALYRGLHRVSLSVNLGGQTFYRFRVA